jgi:hypothetical protein
LWSVRSSLDHNGRYGEGVLGLPRVSRGCHPDPPRVTEPQRSAIRRNAPFLQDSREPTEIVCGT